MRVLVVEDELRMAALLKRGLEEDSHAVDVASTGPNAVSHASEFDYDAVLLDLMLPGMDGVAGCRELRSADAGCRVPHAQPENARPAPSRAGR